MRTHLLNKDLPYGDYHYAIIIDLSCFYIGVSKGNLVNGATTLLSKSLIILHQVSYLPLYFCTDSNELNCVGIYAYTIHLYAA